MLTYEQKVEAVITYLKASDNGFAKYMNDLEKQKEAPIDVTSDKLDRIIRNTITDYGIKPSLAGFRTLMVALRLINSDPTYLKGINKRLYPDVARITGTTVKSVNSTIAYAVRNFGTPKYFLTVMAARIDNTIKLIGG